MRLLFIFSPIEVLSRYRDPQHQVSENYSYLFWSDLIPTNANPDSLQLSSSIISFAISVI